jgi:uncharacterized protein YkwD
MKNLLVAITIILSLTSSAQTAQETEMFNLVNQVRTNPKSFILVVEAYIKTLETTPESFGSIKLKRVTVTKKTNNAKTISNPLIKEAKELIVFLTSQKPLKALTISPSLYVIAKAQSEYIDSIKKLTHDGPNGESVSKRFKNNIILCGENCAASTSATNAMLLLLIDNGVKDKGHRKNIFLKEFTKIAVSNTNQYWVQDFAY